MLRLHTRASDGGLLRLGGTALLVTTVVTWVLLLWASWSLLFWGGGSIVDSSTQLSAGFADVVYYAGFTIFTLGVGDFEETTPGWRLATAVAGFEGLFLVTLSITYLLSVVSAVVARRALAAQVTALGDTASLIVARAWDGTSFSSAFEQQLVGLSGSLASVAEQHLVYPVLHHFHASRPGASAARAVA